MRLQRCNDDAVTTLLSINSIGNEFDTDKKAGGIGWRLGAYLRFDVCIVYEQSAVLL